MSSVAYDQLRDQLLRLPPDIIRTLKAALDLEPKERQKLLDELSDQQPDKAPLDRRVPPKPMPDGAMRALQWITEHAREYAGQWVALDGARLIAHGRDHAEVWAAAQASGVYLPMVTFVDDPDKIHMGF
jgi:Family of unknown function (DUF5678)